MGGTVPPHGAAQALTSTVFQRPLSDFRKQGFHIDGRLRFRSLPEHSCCLRQQSFSPQLDLARMNLEEKRRADATGICPNDAAIVHLAGALMLKTNDE